MCVCVPTAYLSSYVHMSSAGTEKQSAEAGVMSNNTVPDRSEKSAFIM